MDLVPQDCNIESHMLEHTVQHNVPFNAHSRTRVGTITTSGIVSHPNGQRSLNLQELALAAGFLPSHKFAVSNKTAIRKQIGNAVPYTMGRAMIECAIAALQESDKQLAEFVPDIQMID